MKINQHTAEVISEIERMIAWETYNPNSYNGYTGEDGKEFRYPVFYKEADSDNCRTTKFSIPASAIDEKSIHTIKYRFGSNHLFIGKGILETLEYLEKRYGIDFTALENEYRAREGE